MRQVVRGWLITCSPDADPGDSTPWFASFWEFCGNYCTTRFGSDWHLSPEQSLLLHAEYTVIPYQTNIYTPKGTNNVVKLLFDTTLYDLRQYNMPPDADMIDRDGLRLYVPEAALVQVTETFYVQHPVEAQVVLSGIRDVTPVLGRLLNGGHSVIAGRLAGAFRRVGRGDEADRILGVMKRTGYDVREVNPFEPERALGMLSRVQAPIVGRLQSLWVAMREPVIAAFPEAPGLPSCTKAYMSFVDDIYQNDAYHSLSIEGYRVTPELIDEVCKGNWEPDNRGADRQNRDALAARGYWQAFQLVRTAISQIITGTEACALVRRIYSDWYRELFQPSVDAGIIDPFELAGFRNSAVFLRGSRHVPPRREAVLDAMPALFDLMETEAEPCVRAVLGHWLFGYIHPFPDGNGRVARFVMNGMLASGGYPWTVVRVEDRNAYMAALEAASIDQDIVPFARFVAEQVQWSLEQAARSPGR